jgi:DNA-binding LytR/AlgR family response regulator
MIYCKFADAVDQLSPRLGIRVHRSHWVNYDAIAGVRKAAKKLSLQLKCGSFAPVSRPYQAMVLQMAKSRLIPTVFE